MSEEFTLDKSEVESSWLVEDGQTLRENSFLFEGPHHKMEEAEQLGGKIEISLDTKVFHDYR